MFLRIVFNFENEFSCWVGSTDDIVFCSLFHHVLQFGGLTRHSYQGSPNCRHRDPMKSSHSLVLPVHMAKLEQNRIKHFQLTFWLLESSFAYDGGESITGNPTAVGAVIYIIIAHRTVCDYNSFFCHTQHPKIDQPDRSTFLLQEIGIVLLILLSR